jgi:hypothetical protein
MSKQEITIELKKLADCSKEEARLWSYYSASQDKIVLIEDHPRIKHNPAFALAHELSHWHMARKMPKNLALRWFFETFVEELYILLYYQHRLILK